MNLQKNHNIRGMGEKYSKRCVLQATKSLETNTLKVQSNVEMGTILINKSCPVTDHNKVKKKKKHLCTRRNSVNSGVRAVTSTLRFLAPTPNIYIILQWFVFILPLVQYGA